MRNLINKVISLYLKKIYNISIDKKIEEAEREIQLEKFARKYDISRAEIEKAALEIKKARSGEFVDQTPWEDFKKDIITKLGIEGYRRFVR